MPKHFTFFNTTKYTFEGRKEGEEIILFLHKHWYTLGNKIIGLLLAALIPFVVVILAGQYLIQFQAMAVFAFLWALYYLALWFIFFYILTIYNLNSWIVTNLRIIDRQQHGLFNQEVSELSLINIQDVSFSMDGAIATMMNYGRIDVQTAGKENKFCFSQIPDPQNVKDEIMKIAAVAKGHNGIFTGMDAAEAPQNEKVEITPTIS